MKIYTGTQAVSNFRPTAAKLIYEKFGGDTIWDMSCGWGGRLIGFLASSRKKYIGTEPSSLTFKGLQKIKSEYTLKIRSDEYFSNLNPIIECISKNPNKLVCGNIFYKPWRINPFHMGDHIFACKTKTLLESYQRLLDMYDKKANLDDIFSQTAIGNSAESVLCKSILFSIDPANFLTENCFRNNVVKVDINLMSPFLCKWQHGHMIFRSNFAEEKFYVC